MKNLSRIFCTGGLHACFGKIAVGHHWHRKEAIRRQVGGLLLALLLLSGFCRPTFAAGRKQAPEALKSLAGRLNRESRYLLNLRRELQQVLAGETSKDINSITHLQLIMHAMSLAAARFQCEARLIGVSLFIKEAYVTFYRQQRRDALAGLRVVTAGSLVDIKNSYTKVTNNTALHIIDRAQDAISDVLKHLDNALRPTKSK